MELEQSFVLDVPPTAAWPAFHDFEALAACLPGASVTGPVGADGAWPLRFDVKLGPIAAAFAGLGRLSLDEAARSGRFEGSATDKRSPSRVKGAAAFALQPDGDGCRVDVRVDYTLTGPLAQFSRGGLVRELAAALTAQFAANLQARLAGASNAAASRQTAPPPGPIAAAPADGAVAPPAPAVSPSVASLASGAAAPEAAPMSGQAPVSTATPATPTARPTSGPTPRVPTPAPPVALDAMGLLRGVLAARWHRLLQRLGLRP